MSIDRDTRTQLAGRLFDFEYVAAGSAFAFEAVLDGAADEQVRCALYGLLAFAAGDLRIGGLTSRGLGAVQLEDTRVLDLDGALWHRYLWGQVAPDEWVDLHAYAAQYMEG